MSVPKRLLWVDDNPYQIRPYVLALKDVNYDVIVVTSAGDAKKQLLDDRTIQFAILDVMIPLQDDDEEDPIETLHGHDTGAALGRWIKENRPDIHFFAFSIRQDRDWHDWFEKNACGYATKLELQDTSEFVAFVRDTFELGVKNQKKPRIFIVHGHDDRLLYQLKNYIQNKLALGEPIILHEQPSLGRTIIEKFEDEARMIDLVFVLLTPDDQGSTVSSNSGGRYRARQNVVFELGYFFAKLQRKNGKVILLHKGQLEIPSDISGLIYIDISDGIEAAGEEIRQELRGLGF